MPVGIKTTLQGAKVSISTTSVSFPLNKAAFEALTYTEIGHVGNLGDYGVSPNVVSYNTLATQVTSKAKGVEDAGDLSIEVARVFDDAGQVLLNAAAATKLNYAVKIEYADAPSLSYSNTIVYAAGPVMGPQRLGGSTDDFIREAFTVGFSDQKPITVNPTLGAAPNNTVLPAISGTAQVGQTLTVLEGVWTGDGITYTYQWEEDGTPIPGATSSTYVPVTGDIGAVITCVVTGMNDAGSDAAETAATDAVIAA